MTQTGAACQGTQGQRLQQSKARSNLLVFAASQELLKQVAILLVHVRARQGEELAQQVNGSQPLGFILHLQLMCQQRQHWQQGLWACQMHLQTPCFLTPHPSFVYRPE